MANPNEDIRIAGVGCGLADFLYPHVDFASAAFGKYLSRVAGDGGLEPGGLVFREDFEAFAGGDVDTIVSQVAGDIDQADFNIGGPSIVALIIAAQLLHNRNAEVSYYGAMGDDEVGRRMRATLARMPVDIRNYRIADGPSPTTFVLSDPHYDDGHGERTFINTSGAASQFGPEDLDADFFGADMQVFGGTALVPKIHHALTELLAKGKKRGGINVVHTVYDFPSEKKHPGARWPLGDDEATYPLIDLLAMDREEALRISGTKDIDSACAYFISVGARALVVTDGVKPVRFFSDGSLFGPGPLSQLPVSEAILNELASPDRTIRGDSTGCGDNFVGGMIACMAAQRLSDRPEGEWDLAQAVAVGICAGGCACFHVGGPYIEKAPGEKYEIISRYYRDYRHQVEAIHALPERAL